MRQRNVVLDPELDRLLVVAARGAGVSVNRFVVGLIEREVAGVGRGDGRRSDSGTQAPGVGVGLSGGQVGDGDSERVSVSGGPVGLVSLFEGPDSLGVIA